jgi:hypothetical protein
MALFNSDFEINSDLECLFDVVEGGFLNNDINLITDIDSIVSDIDIYRDNVEQHACIQCPKVYKTIRGLKRHIASKHILESFEIDSSKMYSTENSSNTLSPLKLKSIVEECASLLQMDMCLPFDIRKQFSCEKFSYSLDDAENLWQKLKPIIEQFKGNSDLFYQDYYGLLSENLLASHFSDLALSNTLLTEMSSLILNNLSDIKPNTIESVNTTQEITDIERKSLQYLIGYIFQRVYTKFKSSKNVCKYSQQCVSILLRCRVMEDDTQTLVNIRDRGGLWKVNNIIQDLFLTCENIFRKKTTQVFLKLDPEVLIESMSTNYIVLSLYKQVCNDPESTEVSKNLLEHLITLFVRVRSFSYAKDIIEKHKMRKKTCKTRSLRCEIKKASEGN